MAALVIFGTQKVVFFSAKTWSKLTENRLSRIFGLLFMIGEIQKGEVYLMEDGRYLQIGHLPVHNYHLFEVI